MNVTLTAMGYGLANWLAFGVITLTAAVTIGLLTYDIGTGKTIVVWTKGYLIGGQIIATIVAVAFAILFATDFGLPIAEWFMCLIPDVIISTLMTGVVLIILEGIVWSAFMALSLLMASLRRGCLIRRLGKV